MSTKQATISRVALGIACIVGVAAFLYPFVLAPSRGGSGSYAGAGQPSAVFLVFLPVLVVLVFGGMMRWAGSKEIAVLSALVAVNVALRFVPLPLGGSAIFFLLLLAGYAWGATFGFLLGALTIFISAFWAGGLGPWVPFQMMAAGWVGMSGALFSPLKRLQKRHGATVVVVLGIAGLIWGYLFGAIMNLWFWPYLGNVSRGADAVKQYLGFYLATSAFWDTGRAVVNFVLIAALGGPVLKVLERFQKRFGGTIV